MWDGISTSKVERWFENAGPGSGFGIFSLLRGSILRAGGDGGPFPLYG